MTNESKSIPLEATPDHSRSTVTNRSDAETHTATMEWLDEFTEKMSTPSEIEEAFFARRRKLKLGVGLDADGDLVRAADSE